MKATVVVPTTAGLVTIRRITRRPGVPTSFVVADGDYRPLYASDDYGRLTAPGGALASAIGPEQAGSFELRVDRPFETGRSWEVPVCVAHALLASEFALVDNIEEADLAVFATGAVDADLSIVPMHYSVASKLEKSAAWFRAAVDAGCRIVVAIPPGEDADALSAQARQLVGASPENVIVASRVSEILFKCADRDMPALPPGPAAVAAASVDRTQGPKAERRGARRLVAALVGLTALCATAWAAFDRYMRVAEPPARPNDVAALPSAQLTPAETGSKPVEQPPVATAPLVAPAPAETAPPVAAPRMTVTEVRAPSGGSCTQLLYGDGDVGGERRAVPVAGEGRFEATDPDGLCAIEYDATSGGTAGELALEGAILNAGQRRVSAPGSNANRFRKLVVFLRPGQSAPIAYRILFYDKATPTVQTSYAHELRRAR